MDDALFTLPEAARLLGITPDTLRQAIHRGALPARKVGRDWVITGDELDRQLAKRGKPPRNAT